MFSIVWKCLDSFVIIRESFSNWIVLYIRIRCDLFAQLSLSDVLDIEKCTCNYVSVAVLNLYDHERLIFSHLSCSPSIWSDNILECSFNYTISLNNLATLSGCLSSVFLSRQTILPGVVNLALNSILPKYLPTLYEGTFPFQAPRIFQKMHASSLCREFLDFCLWSPFLPLILIYLCHNNVIFHPNKLHKW